MNLKIEDSIEKEYKIKLDPSKTILYGNVMSVFNK